MFSFKQVKERFVSPHSYLPNKEEESDEELPESKKDGEEQDVEDMDTNPVEHAPFEQFVFPPSRYQEVIQHPQHFFFKRELIPLTLLPLSPGVLNGLEAIDEITNDQKKTASVHMALPILVHHSPLMALFLDNMPPECRTMPTKQRYMNWTQSVFQLRSLIPLIIDYALPFHSSVSNEYPQECMNEFLEQIQSYEEMHRKRVDDLFAEENVGHVLKLFVDYCVEFSYYYIHSLEHFIYKVLIEPHGSLISLEQVLTPIDVNLHISKCDKKEVALKCVVDFFVYKVFATEEHGKKYAGPDYVFRNPIQLGAIEARVKSAPPDQLYQGCLDTQTLREYLQFCDPKINVL